MGCAGNCWIGPAVRGPALSLLLDPLSPVVVVEPQVPSAAVRLSNPNVWIVAWLVAEQIADPDPTKMFSRGTLWVKPDSLEVGSTSKMLYPHELFE